MEKNTAIAWLTDFAASIADHAAELTELDRLIGDADHGSNLHRGMRAVAAIDGDELPDAATYLKKAGMTLVSTVGGASGPLYGTFLLRFAASLAGAPDDLAAAWRAGLDGVASRGKAGVGDKTMIDALQPAVEALEAPAASPAEALQAAARAAARGRDESAPLVARKGRAAYLGERSAGHVDPGAASITMLVESAARTLA